MKIYFLKKKKIKLDKIFPKSKFKSNIIINDVKPLTSAKKNDLTFLESSKYKDLSIHTKASVCLTTDKLKGFLPTNVELIIVKNVLYELAKIIKLIYPSADIDYPDLSLKISTKKI